MFRLDSPYSPGKNRSVIFLAAMSVSVLLLIGSGCDPSGGQDSRLNAESGSNPSSSNTVSEEEVPAKTNDSLGSIELSSESASRSRGNGDRSVESVAVRDVLPGMGSEPGELEWDGEGVQLGQVFLPKSESEKQKAKEEQERLEKEQMAREAAEVFGKPWIVPNLGLKMVWIEPGTF